MEQNKIGKPERVTQNRIIQLFKNELGYTYLGNWEEETRVQPIEVIKVFLTDNSQILKSLVYLLETCKPFN
jgi:type I restriction enzyme R subunit